MPICSHITNDRARGNVRSYRPDMMFPSSYNRNMARRGAPKGLVAWYLPEWMAARGLSGRGAQAKMMELTGWAKATMSQLYNGDQDFSPKILHEAARALNAEPFELLITPERAMGLRRFQETAIKLAAENKPEFQSAPLEEGRVQSGMSG